MRAPLSMNMIKDQKTWSVNSAQQEAMAAKLINIHTGRKTLVLLHEFFSGKAEVL